MLLCVSPAFMPDEAVTQNVIVNPNFANGQLSQAKCFTDPFRRVHRPLPHACADREDYVTELTVKGDAVLTELLTADGTTLADGRELNTGAS
ncbi:hypothetical protein D1Y84_00220 [Acidipila sp. EB88]|nr:hypothetical protein D1Y84_00220 [Acidipila sp. EB88]